MRNDSEMGEVIAEREYEAHEGDGAGSRTVVLRIGRPTPYPEPDSGWVCPVQVLGMGEDEVLQVGGVDGVQALFLALAMAGARLTYPRSGVSVTWLGGSDLGLPLPDLGAAGFASEEPG